MKEFSGRDMRGYATSSLKRRLISVLIKNSLDNIDQLIEKVKTDSTFRASLVEALSVYTTEMFRDPTFWKVLREKVLPEISINDSFNIWHAGSSIGYEIFSMLIVLEELGILEKAKIFATDVSPKAIKSSKSGLVVKDNFPQYLDNYKVSGGAKEFEKYFDEFDNRNLIFRPDLISKVNFKLHDLVNGGLFFKFDLILCRNVLIYFNSNLQRKVFELFHKSLFHKGFLAIGSKESFIWGNDIFSSYAIYDETEKIIRKGTPLLY